jgi:protein CpxP
MLMHVQRLAGVMALTFLLGGIAQAQTSGQETMRGQAEQTEPGSHKMEYGQRGHAHGGYGMGHGMIGRSGRTSHFLHHLLRHHGDLGLTEEQVTKLKQLSLDFDRTKIKGKADIMVAERELASLVHDEKTDLTAIEAKVKESEALQTKLRVASIKAKREAWSLLTPEQREKEKAEFRSKMRHRHEG